MRKFVLIILAAAFVFVPTATTLNAMNFTPPIVIDHTCTDITQIPLIWVHGVQQNIKIYYGHTSHGYQITTGLDMIEADNHAYADSAGYKTLPAIAGSLCIFNVPDMVPEGYWNSAAGMNATRNALRNNPSINVSMFMWCYQMDGAPASYVQAYLDSTSKLENEFPNVTFVYATGHAQTAGWEGYNRSQRNQQIRQYCLDNHKVLFDFADLDCWWFNPATQQWEDTTYDYQGTAVPLQHPHFGVNECDICGHTTRESCEQKGKAFWWLLVSIAGSRSIFTDVEQTPAAASLLDLHQNFPNPFDGVTSLGFTLNGASRVKLQVFDVAGRLVKTVCNAYMQKGTHSFSWNGLDSRGRALPNGIYFCRLTGPGSASVTRKMMKLR